MLPILFSNRRNVTVKESMGQAFHSGNTGTPVLDNTHAFVEYRLVTNVEEGDHSIFIGEVVEAAINQEPEGRADEAILLLKDL